MKNNYKNQNKNQKKNKSNNKNKTSVKQLQFGEQIRRFLPSALMRNNMFDEIIKNITIMKVLTSKDLKLCKVYIRINEKNYNNILQICNQNNKKIAFDLSKMVLFRIIPEIRFYIDETPQVLNEIKDLIMQIPIAYNE